MRRCLWLDLGSCLMIQAACLILLRVLAVLDDASRAWPVDSPATSTMSFNLVRHERVPPC